MQLSLHTSSPPMPAFLSVSTSLPTAPLIFRAALYRLLLGSVALLATLFLTACDGSRSVDAPAVEATVALTVVPSLGRIRRGLAQAFTANGSALSEEIETGDDGRATLRIPASHSGPVMLRLRGQAGATYFDEELETDVDLGPDVQMRALLSSPRAEAGLSILTELAVRLAEASGETIDAAAVDAANEQIRAALAPDVADLLTPPILVDADTAAGSIEDTDAGRLAARLAALAALAPGDAAPALRILEQLSADVADGVVDGVGPDGAIDGLAYTPATFVEDFVGAIRDFAASFGSSALQTAAADDSVVRGSGALLGSGGSGGGEDSGGDDTGGEDTGGGGSSGNTTAATVIAALVGSYDLVYDDRSPDSTRDPFEDEALVTAVVTAEGSLTIGSLTFTDPFHRIFGTTPNTAEVIWLDAGNGLEYALTDNNGGVFNEINVGDTAAADAVNGVPGFLGQLRKPVVEVDAAAEIAAFAGTYSARVVSSCPATQALCPEATPAGDSVEIVVGADGSVNYGGVIVDPAVADATFTDTRGASTEPGLNLTVPGINDGTLTLNLYVDADALVAFRLRQVAPCGSGCSQVSTAYSELPENRAEVLAFFEDFVTASTPPLTLTVVVDDPTYGSNANGYTDTPSGTTSLCRTFSVAGARSPTDFSNSRPEFRWTAGPSDLTFDYTRNISRFASTADSATVSVSPGQFVLFTDGNVRFEEGFRSPSTGLLDLPRDVSTSEQSAIDAVCAEFSSLGGSILTPSSPTNFNLQVVETVSGKVVLNSFGRNPNGVTSTPFAVVLPEGIEYTVTGTAGANTCMVSGGVLTLTGADVTSVSVDCAPPME